MDRTFASGAAGAPPLPPASPSFGYATDGNPATSTPATKPGKYWYHMITEELRKVIVDAGLTPDHTNVNQLSLAVQSLISSAAQPAGSVIFVAKKTAPAGYLKANGALLSRTAYAALWAAAQASENISATDGAWQAGMFSPGDGATTFRIPDLRGEFIRGWDDGRGVDSGRALGSHQADEFKSHAHNYNGTDLLYLGTGSTSAYVNYAGLTGNAGGVETRPRNIALLGCIKY